MSIKAVRRTIGIVAPTVGLAQSLATELNMGRTVPLSVRSIKGGATRGIHLSALLVTAECWPIDRSVMADLLPCLHRERAYVFRIDRAIDPVKAARVLTSSGVPHVSGA